MATQCRGTKTKRINRHKLAVIQAYIIIGTLVLIGFIGGLVVGRATAPKKQVTVTETVEVPSYEADSLPVAEEVTYFDVPLSHSLQRYIYEVCADENVPVSLIIAMIDQESKFNPEVVSKTGDYGLMQINTINHEWLAEEYRTADMLDPYQNVFCGIKVIGSYIQNYNDYLINCLNGTYDLRDFSFREHSWDDFLTMQTAFSHTISKTVKCKRWEKFIKEVTQNDEDKADFLQRALGYSMLGMSNEECMFILHGKTTRNGKSTLLNTIETMLGDYAKVAPVGMICRGDRQKDAEAASPTLAGLKGKRFVTMSESNEYGKLDEEKIKQLTGGEEISARALYQSAITFKPQFTLWLSCNDLPMVTDKSLFASERIKVVEFNRHFSPEEQDTHLKDELCEQSSMSGIFMWLVRGYIHYKERGLAMSGSLKSVVTKYERDNDLVLQFLENRCERVPEESSPTVIKAKDLYNAFKIWAKSEGAYILSARKFNSEMERHPEWFDRKSTSSGYATYCGLKLKEVL